MMKGPTLFLLSLFLFSSISAVEEYNLENEEYFDSLTTDLKDYLFELEESSKKDNEDIKILTKLNSDKSYTTGNVDTIEDYDNLLPDFDVPFIEESKLTVVQKHHEFLDTLVSILNPDFFSEDPRMFLGDHDSYFKIVKKRSIVFFYVSRVILYLTIFYLIMKFLNKEEKGKTVDGLFNKKEYDCVFWTQTISLGVLLLGAAAIFFMIGAPKAIIDNAGSTLVYGFREINVTSHEISTLIDEINFEKIKITQDEMGFFSITNIIKNQLKIIEEDVTIAKDFAFNMLKNPYLTNYSTSISLFFLAVVLTGIYTISFVNKNSHFQLILFLAAGLSMSYLLYTMGMYFSNYSGLHDICNSIIKTGEADNMPENGLGLVKFVGCTCENAFFQQLITNLKAQNSARKLFNNEMFKIHRDYIVTSDDAMEVTEYLNKIDSSNVNIKTYSDLLSKNNSILAKLMTINKCNRIKIWLKNEEYDLCYEGSSSLLNIFWVFAFMAFVFCVLIYSSIRGMKVFNQLEMLNIVKSNTFDKRRYTNDIKVD